MMKKPGEVTFYGDGAGNWVRREWDCQCAKKVFMAGRCQGVRGHKEECWCYTEDGSFCQNHADGSATNTPPGHEKYVSPEQMYDKRFLHFYKDSIVNDLETIARLNAGKIGLNESLDCPISKEEFSRLAGDENE